MKTAGGAAARRWPSAENFPCMYEFKITPYWLPPVASEVIGSPSNSDTPYRGSSLPPSSHNSIPDYFTDQPTAATSSTTQAYSPYRGSYDGCLWNAQGLFASKASVQNKKWDKVWDTLRYRDFGIISETHSNVGKCWAKRDIIAAHGFRAF